MFSRSSPDSRGPGRSAVTVIVPDDPSEYAVERLESERARLARHLSRGLERRQPARRRRASPLSAEQRRRSDVPENARRPADPDPAGPDRLPQSLLLPGPRRLARVPAADRARARERRPGGVLLRPCPRRRDRRRSGRSRPARPLSGWASTIRVAARGRAAARSGGRGAAGARASRRSCASGTDFHHKNRVFALRMLERLRSSQGWEGMLVLAGPKVAHGSSRERRSGAARRAPAVWPAAVLDVGAVSEAEKDVAVRTLGARRSTRR